MRSIARELMAEERTAISQFYGAAFGAGDEPEIESGKWRR
jgi:hypothetical protein